MVPVIALCTDFGDVDPYVGVMKGCILGITPEARLVDLCHQIPPQDRIATALVLDAAVDYFPPGTIYLTVVDPGVGSARRPLAVRFARGVLVGPDNGIFDLVLGRYPVVEAVSLEVTTYRLEPVSATFHGRDIFAPAAAHLAAGASLPQLGPAVTVTPQLQLPEPLWQDDTVTLTVLAVDRFGNLILNLRAEQLPSGRWLRLDPGRGGAPIEQLSSTYADVQPGEALAYIGSGDRLEVAVRDGSATEKLALGRGDRLVLHLRP